MGILFITAWRLDVEEVDFYDLHVNSAVKWPSVVFCAAWSLEIRYRSSVWSAVCIDGYLICAQNVWKLCKEGKICLWPSALLHSAAGRLNESQSVCVCVCQSLTAIAGSFSFLKTPKKQLNIDLYLETWWWLKSYFQTLSSPNLYSFFTVSVNRFIGT